jgi:hypothetical protein
MSAFKQETQNVVSDFREYESSDDGVPKATGPSKAIESARLGLALLALLCSITILGTSGHTLSVYNKTHLGQDFFLPLWPNEFDARPSVALVTCASIIVLSSLIGLIAAKLPFINSKPLISTSLAVLTPIISLIASLIATSFFYGANRSETNYSLHSWTCQWSSIPMDAQPYWGTLCKESKVALYLMIILIPISVMALGVGSFMGLAAKKNGGGRLAPRKGSPAMS